LESQAVAQGRASPSGGGRDDARVAVFRSIYDQIPMTPGMQIQQEIAASATTLILSGPDERAQDGIGGAPDAAARTPRSWTFARQGSCRSKCHRLLSIRRP